MGGAIRFTESRPAASGAAADGESGARLRTPQLDIVLLLGKTGSMPHAQREGWCRACAEQGFEVAYCEAWPDSWPAPALWQSAVIVAILDPNGASLQCLDAIARAANRALLVLPPEATNLSAATLEAYGCLTLRLGQEPALLAWYRKQLTHRQQVPRPRALVNLTERTLSVDRECIPLQPREAQLLAILAESQGANPPERVCTRLWGGDDVAKRRMLRQYFYQLRLKLGRYSGLLQYVRGEGYRCFLDLELIEVQ